MNQPPHVMRLVNEATELCARMDDLKQLLGRPWNSPVEEKLLQAQQQAMTLYAQMLSARLQLATGVAPP